MQINGVDIHDQFAEGFRMWAVRLVVTADNDRWLGHAVREVTGYGASVIGCDAEVGAEVDLAGADTPDGRPGAAVLLFAFNAQALAKAAPNRVGQCLMTCPTTAVYDGLPHVADGEDSARLALGRQLRFFGDGFQKSKVIADACGRSRRYWRVPVMDGEFVVEDTIGAVKAVGGGNFLICGSSRGQALEAAEAAVAAIAPLPQVITPFPGGVVRSGSKVGSRYKALFASTNDAWCPTLRDRCASNAPVGTAAVYEIVIDGLTYDAVAGAIRRGVLAACAMPGVLAISAGNYGGNLGKFHFHLRQIMQPQEAAP